MSKSKKFAVCVSLNGATLILDTFATMQEASDEILDGRSSRWVDAFVVGR
jgi:hypothetical protein